MLVSQDDNFRHSPKVHCGNHFYVVNLLTHKWSKLCNRFHVSEKRSNEGDKWLIKSHSDKTYKVVVFDNAFGGRWGHCFAKTFDSKMGGWTGDKFPDLNVNGCWTNWAYLNGIFYRVVSDYYNSNRFQEVMTFDLGKLHFEVVGAPLIHINSQRKELVVCDGELLILMYDADYGNNSGDGYKEHWFESVIVLRIDLWS